MTLVKYAVSEHVATITLNDGENRFNPTFLHAYLDVLDEVENSTDATTLVVTSSHEKIFSNGIDLEWLVPVIQQKNVTQAKDFFYLLNRLFKRIATFPLVTIAGISGHAFAGGAILACAFDFRLMRSGRGFFCFPEIDLGIPFLPGMLELLKSANPQYKLDELHYAGSRLTAEECQQHHIITRACHIDTLMAETIAFAKSFKKSRKTISEMKKRYNKNIIHAIEVEDIPYIETGQLS